MTCELEMCPLFRVFEIVDIFCMKICEQQLHLVEMAGKLERCAAGISTAADDGMGNLAGTPAGLGSLWGALTPYPITTCLFFSFPPLSPSPPTQHPTQCVSRTSSSQRQRPPAPRRSNSPPPPSSPSPRTAASSTPSSTTASTRP